MEIQSAFSSGVQGFQSANEDAAKAATAIASESYQSDPVNQPQEVTRSEEKVSEPQELPDLNQEVVNLKVAEHQAKASSEIIQSADDSLGTLLDVTA